jgi:hypothetical protein
MASVYTILKATTLESNMSLSENGYKFLDISVHAA